MSRTASVLSAVVLGLAGLAWTSSALAESAEERVDRYLGNIRTLQAGFHQEIADAGGNVREVADGNLAVQKPGRFRWDYRNPSPQLLVSDGRSIWLYDEELAQVTVRKAGETLSATPAALLSGRSRASETFHAAFAEASDGVEWLVLTPRLDDTDFSEVRLGFRDGELVRMELQDRLGQTTRIAFSEVRMNPTLPTGLFTFEPPPGVDVVGAAGGS